MLGAAPILSPDAPELGVVNPPLGSVCGFPKVVEEDPIGGTVP